ncbi:MAG: lysylphosphatidylglycerol synthase domain-containing protein [Gemmatimonadales bacterium]
MFPSPVHQLVALALCGTEIVVRAVRIRLLMPEVDLSFRQAITVNAYGDAASAVTPGRLGGEPARFVGFRRAGIEAPRVLAGLAVETLIDWVLLAVATLALSIAFAETAVAGVRRLAALAAGPGARVFVMIVGALIGLSGVLLWWYRRRSISEAPSTLALAWRSARALGARRVALAGALTALSMATRTAILPVLVAGVAGLAPGAVVLGSFVLLFGQLALPTPAGAGGVELGFVGGFSGTLGPDALAALLLAWRTWTTIVGAALGAILFARGALLGWSGSRGAKE